MTVRISANGTQLGTFDLRESECKSLKVQLPAGPRELVRFSFSSHAVDANGRRVAFLVQETNLFCEEDLHSLG